MTDLPTPQISMQIRTFAEGPLDIAAMLQLARDLDVSRSRPPRRVGPHRLRPLTRRGLRRPQGRRHRRRTPTDQSRRNLARAAHGPERHRCDDRSHPPRHGHPARRAAATGGAGQDRRHPRRHLRRAGWTSASASDGRRRSTTWSGSTSPTGAGSSTRPSTSAGPCGPSRARPTLAQPPVRGHPPDAQAVPGRRGAHLGQRHGEPCRGPSPRPVRHRLDPVGASGRRPRSGDPADAPAHRRRGRRPCRLQVQGNARASANEAGDLDVEADHRGHPTARGRGRDRRPSRYRSP